MSASMKAGFVEAPGRLYRVDNMKPVDCIMDVHRVERDEDQTTFVGLGCFKGFKRLTVPNHVYVLFRASK